MSDRSATLSLPFILPNQAQKHVTHNEALTDLDTLVQLSLQDIARNTPPEAPQEGDTFGISATPDGAWANQAGNIASFQAGAWRFYTPKEGWHGWNIANNQSVVFQNGIWQPAPSGASALPDLNNIDALGVNATADTINRLTVASEASLFNHAGAGHQLKINKAMADQAGSLLFQTGFSARVEMGTLGEENFSLKLTPDGNTWTTALRADAVSGNITFPAGISLPAGTENLLINPEFSINQRVFTAPTLAAGLYGHDRWQAMAGGATYQVANSGVTLEAGGLQQVIEIDTHSTDTFSLSFEQFDAGLSVTLGGRAPAYSSPDRRTHRFENVASTNGQLTLKVSGTGRFMRPFLITGTGYPHWSPRPKAMELSLCSRYFTKSFGINVAPASINDNRWQQAAFSWHPNVATGARTFFPAEMRTRPKVTFFSSTDGQDGDWYVLISGQFIQCEARASRTDERGFMPGIFNPDLTLDIGNGYFIGGHWTAEAEL